MCRFVRLWVGAVALAASAAHAAPGDSQQYQSDQQAWEGLKGRLTLGTTVTPFRADFGVVTGDEQKVSSLSVMGDYYFSRPWLGTRGGLRATSGLLLGQRSSLWSSPSAMDHRSGPDNTAEPTSTLPYLGVGYTGLSSKGGWGLSADLGLMAYSRSNMRLGTQSLDDTMRDLRFSPLLQLGVSYSF
ncbi:hypothetical protein ACVNIS_04545 [Sphaerotilaceae bacterium SBD11-9]